MPDLSKDQKKLKSFAPSSPKQKHKYESVVKSRPKVPETPISKTSTPKLSSHRISSERYMTPVSSAKSTPKSQTPKISPHRMAPESEYEEYSSKYSSFSPELKVVIEIGVPFLFDIFRCMNIVMKMIRISPLRGIPIFYFFMFSK